MRHVVMFSGGVGSWAAAVRVAQRHGKESVTLLFTDTLEEDADLYRFLIEGAAHIYRLQGHALLSGLLARALNTPPQWEPEARRAHLASLRVDMRTVLPGLVWLAGDDTIWSLFRDKRFLANTRVDICSRVLKREASAAWLKQYADPSATTLHVGVDWTEAHRFDRMRARWGEQGWRVEAPLCEASYVTKDGMFALLAKAGIELPRLYRLGFAHNNCGGGCVKAGVGHFAHLLRTLPDVYAHWERNEEAMRAMLDRNVSILRDRTGGQSAPLPLTQLRRRIEAGYQPDLFEIGGCGCFVDEPDELPEAA